MLIIGQDRETGFMQLTLKISGKTTEKRRNFHRGSMSDQGINDSQNTVTEKLGELH